MTKRAKPSVDRILESSERVFARHGYGETSLRQLMDGARISTTAFYARFQTKEEVLRELVLRLLNDLISRARNELGDAQGLDDGFRRGVRVLYDVLVPRRDLVRITMTEAAASEEITKALGRLYSTLADLLAQRLQEMSARGNIADVDAHAVAWGLVGALNMQILRWAVYGQVSDGALEKTLHSVADSFLPSLRPRSGVRKKRKAS